MDQLKTSSPSLPHFTSNQGIFGLSGSLFYLKVCCLLQVSNENICWGLLYLLLLCFMHFVYKKKKKTKIQKIQKKKKEKKKIFRFKKEKEKRTRGIGPSSHFNSFSKYFFFSNLFLKTFFFF